jgi:fatty-acid desaturase
MADEIYLLQFVFYVVVLFILAFTMGGWMGFACGLLGGFIILYLIVMLINSDLHQYDTRGR